MSKVRVLYFAADPGGAEGARGRLDEEVREINEKVRGSRFREALEFHVRWAVRPDDLIQAFNEVRPRIVHFSGHAGDTGLIFFGEAGAAPRPVPAGALAELFRVFAGDIRLVVLSGCYSGAQAEAVARFVDCVTGTPGPLPHDLKTTFSASFYRALAFGGSAQHACEQARLGMKLNHAADAHLPVLLARDGVDPGKIVLVVPPVVKRFSDVAYGTSRFGPFDGAWEDRGTLTITGTEVVFQGRKTVPMENVWEVTHGKHGGDRFVNWIRVLYGDPGDPSVAYLSRDTFLSNMLGGSDDLYAAFQALVYAPR